MCTQEINNKQHCRNDNQIRKDTFAYNKTEISLRLLNTTLVMINSVSTMLVKLRSVFLRKKRNQKATKYVCLTITFFFVMLIISIFAGVSGDVTVVVDSTSGLPRDHIVKLTPYSLRSSLLELFRRQIRKVENYQRALIAHRARGKAFTGFSLVGVAPSQRTQVITGRVIIESSLSCAISVCFYFFLMTIFQLLFIVFRFRVSLCFRYENILANG